MAANLAAAGSDWAGACNIGTGTETTVIELADALRALGDGAPFELEHAPARPGEIVRSAVDPALAREVARLGGARRRSPRGSSARWPSSAADGADRDGQGPRPRTPNLGIAKPDSRGTDAPRPSHARHRNRSPSRTTTASRAPSSRSPTIPRSRPSSARSSKALAAFAAVLVLALAAPLTWIAPAPPVAPSKVGDQPAATLGNSKAALAAADDEDADGGD